MTPIESAHEWLFCVSNLPDVEGVFEVEMETKGSWLEALRNTEPSHRARIDAAVRCLARRQPIPPLSHVERCLFALRIEVARGLCEAAACAGGDPTSSIFPTHIHAMSETQFLDWALVDGWYGLGIHQWHGLSCWYLDWGIPERE